MLDQRADVEEVVLEFENRKEKLTEFCVRTKALIEECLKDANIQFQSVQARVKRKSKLRAKYLDPKKNYKRLDDITDQAALRIITYYEDELDKAAEIIKREFEIDRENSIDKREADPDHFGYYALNYVCKHHPRRLLDVEYKKFTDIRCEIQITSILRHAWSEIEHGWYDLKDAYPDAIKRRFYRLAALLEIVESEFLALRKQRTDYQRSVALRVEAKVSDIPIDVVSLKSFCEQDTIVAELDQKFAELAKKQLVAPLDRNLELRARAAKYASLATLTDLRNKLEKHKSSLLEYIDRCFDLWGAPSYPTIERGAAVFHLAMFLVLSQGESAAWMIAKHLNLAIPDREKFKKQAQIAVDIRSREID